MQRRSFLRAILAGGIAPAFVGSSILMPVRAIATPILFEPAWTLQEVLNEITRRQILRLAEFRASCTSPAHLIEKQESGDFFREKHAKWESDRRQNWMAVWGPRLELAG